MGYICNSLGLSYSFWNNKNTVYGQKKYEVDLSNEEFNDQLVQLKNNLKNI